MALSSRRILAFAMIGALLCVIGAYTYYAYQSQPPPKGPRVSVTSLPLEFSMELETTEFQEGENVTIWLSARNLGNETTTLRWSEHYREMHFDFLITDANDTPIYQWTRVHLASHAVREMTLEPNEELTSVYVWHQTTDYPCTQVPLGTYNTRGSTRRLALIVDDQVSIITLETPTIAITIGAHAVASQYPLRLAMVLGKTTFEVGEPVNMTFLLKNIGNEKMFYCCGDRFSFIVLAAGGAKMFEQERGYTTICIPCGLPPGLTEVAHDTWYQDYAPLCRGWDEDPLYEYKKVPQGVYQIVGLFICEPSNLTIETPPVTILIA